MVGRRKSTDSSISESSASTNPSDIEFVRKSVRPAKNFCIRPGSEESDKDAPNNALSFLNLKPAPPTPVIDLSSHGVDSRGLRVESTPPIISKSRSLSQGVVSLLDVEVYSTPVPHHHGKSIDEKVLTEEIIPLDCPSETGFLRYNTRSRSTSLSSMQSSSRASSPISLPETVASTDSRNDCDPDSSFDDRYIGVNKRGRASKAPKRPRLKLSESAFFWIVRADQLLGTVFQGYSDSIPLVDYIRQTIQNELQVDVSEFYVNELIRLRLDKFKKEYMSEILESMKTGLSNSKKLFRNNDSPFSLSVKQPQIQSQIKLTPTVKPGIAEGKVRRPSLPMAPSPDTSSTTDTEPENCNYRGPSLACLPPSSATKIPSLNAFSERTGPVSHPPSEAAERGQQERASPTPRSFFDFTELSYSSSEDSESNTIPTHSVQTINHNVSSRGSSPETLFHPTFRDFSRKITERSFSTSLTSNYNYIPNQRKNHLTDPKQYSIKWSVLKEAVSQDENHPFTEDEEEVVHILQEIISNYITEADIDVFYDRQARNAEEDSLYVVDPRSKEKIRIPQEFDRFLKDRLREDQYKEF